MDATLLTTEIRAEQDVVLARQRARQIAGLLGFEVAQQTRIATAVSELARNVFQYAGSGRVQFALCSLDNALVIRISDRGPGIANVETILGGQYTSATGMGLGLLGARRLMDGFQIDTAAGKGTRIETRKQLPRGAAAISPQLVAKIGQELARTVPKTTALEEVQAHNQELLRALEDVRGLQMQVQRFEAERADTGRALTLMQQALLEPAASGFRAFSVESLFSVLRGWFGPQYAPGQLRLELDAPAGMPAIQGDEVALARTLIGIIARALGSAAGGGVRVWVASDPQTPEVVFELQRTTGEPLKTLRVPQDASQPVLVRPAKEVVVPEARPPEPVEAPAVDQRSVLVVTRDDAAFARYVEWLRPAALTAVRAFGPAAARDVLRAKHPVAVVLDGMLHDEALWTFLSELAPRRNDGSLGVFAVGDERDRARVGPVLGEDFSVRPLRPDWLLPKLEVLTHEAPSRKALIIDDDEVARYVLRRTLSTELSWAVSEAENGTDGLERARTERPEVIFLDLRMPGMSGFEVLESLKSDPDTRDIPVIIHTSAALSDSEVARLTLDAAAIVSKDSEGTAISSALRSAGLGVAKL